MSDGEESPADRQDAPHVPDDAPPIEDAYAATTPPDETLDEDDPELLSSSARSLETDESEPEELASAADGRTASGADQDDLGDAVSVTEEAEPEVVSAERPQQQQLAHELSAHRTAVELKRVEAEVRTLLDTCDSKRKRKLSGSRRWRELEEEILTWRYSGRVDDRTLARLQQLIARRHHLFQRLRYFSATRSGWNT